MLVTSGNYSGLYRNWMRVGSSASVAGAGHRSEAQRFVIRYRTEVQTCGALQDYVAVVVVVVVVVVGAPPS